MKAGVSPDSHWLGCNSKKFLIHDVMYFKVMVLVEEIVMGAQGMVVWELVLKKTGMR